MVYYLGYYYTDTKVSKGASWAQSRKMDYIIQSLINENIDVHVLSCAYYGTFKNYYNRGFTTTIRPHFLFTKFPELNYKTFIGKVISRLLLYIALILRLLSIKKDDTLIVYHSVIVSKIVYHIRKIKKLHIITEVEEIYSLAFPDKYNSEDGERKALSVSDGYIFVNDLLHTYLKTNKPWIPVYGSYSSCKDMHCERMFNDKKIHLVYAGSFSMHKGGVFHAISSATYLSDKYEMHILGYGDERSVKKLKERIERVNESSPCKVHYHGMLSGWEFDNFLLSCNIGLNPQNSGEYMETAFPSKVLSYLSHGLNVVTTNLKSLSVSKVADLLMFTEEPTPERIANAILKIDIKSPNYIYSRIETLDMNFRKDLVKMLKQ